MWYYLFNENGDCVAHQENEDFIPLADGYQVRTSEDKCDNLKYIKIDGAGISYNVPLDEFKFFKRIKYLKAHRDEAEIEPVEYNGHRWDIDEKSLQRINGAIIALSDGGSIDWTSADDELIEGVTAADLKGVIAATAVRANELHEKYRVLREQLNNAQTLEEARAVKWK